MNKQFEFIKEYLKKDRRLLIFYTHTKNTHKEIQWDVVQFLQDFTNTHCTTDVNREYVTGELYNEKCHLNARLLYEGTIDVEIYVIKEEF